MNGLLERFDEMGNSFFLRLENMNKNEQVLFFLGGITVVLAYGKMKSGTTPHESSSCICLFISLNL
jgi:hypothetical protein